MGKHTRRIKKERKWTKVVLSLLLLTFSSILFAGAYLLGTDGWREFDPASVKENISVSLTILDGDGEEYAVLSDGELRRYAPLSSIPAHTKNAFVAIEDARFYSHNGIDAVRIGGALLEDIKSGGIVQGASTISQQLIKNTTLTSGQTVGRKLGEIMMAFKLEQYYTKDEILEMYLNTVYFGSGAYGIETAAHEYFGKNAGELSLAESAMLAGTLKAPSRYSPRADMDNSLARMSLVLDAMAENGFITTAQAEAAKQERPLLAKESANDYPFGYYTDMVQTSAKNCLGVTQSELLSGGYTIYANLDPSLQSKIENLQQDDTLFPPNAGDGDPCQCAVVVLNAKTGDVSAILGGRKHTGMLCLDRTTSMRRQPGSAIKPVMVFAPAMEYGGWSTTDLLLDEPTDFDGYAPRDSGSTYKGWVTLRDTAAYSINIPAVQLLKDVGIEKAKAYASSVGIPFASSDKNLSLALGGFTTGVTPLELASSYMPFATGGSYKKASPISKITDRYGNTVYENSSAPVSVLSEESSYLVTSMLCSSAEYGTSDDISACGVPLAAKTGTSTYDDATNNKDAWIVAYNSDYIVCVWMGFDKTDDGHSLEKGVTGGTYPAAFASAFFSAVYPDPSAAPVFSAPSTIEQVEIDGRLLKEETRLCLADASTPADDVVTEYYREGQAPEDTQQYSTPDEPKTDFSVASGQSSPVLSFSTEAGAFYAVYRDDVPIAYIAGDGRPYQLSDEGADVSGQYIYKIRCIKNRSSDTAIRLYSP